MFYTERKDLLAVRERMLNLRSKIEDSDIFHVWSLFGSTMQDMWRINGHLCSYICFYTVQGIQIDDHPNSRTCFVSLEISS